MLADVQRRLTALGYAPGKPDNIYGPATERALMAALDNLSETSRKPLANLSAVTSQPVATRPIEGIVIHCTATPEGRDYGVEDVDAWHRAQGWNGCGYHYVVRIDGTVEPGRPEAKIGAHVKGHNTGTLGVVYVGGCDALMSPKDTRTPAQKAALMALCEALIAKYPIKWVKGHRDFPGVPKACPSFSVADDPLGSLV